MTDFDEQHQDEPAAGARLSFKVTRTGSSATWEFKIKDLPLEDEAQMKLLAERGRKFAHQEYLNLVNQIPVMTFGKK